MNSGHWNAPFSSIRNNCEHGLSTFQEKQKKDAENYSKKDI